MLHSRIGGEVHMREAEGNGRAGRVLVVDDEPNICALLSATLRLTGFEVRIEHGGHDALDRGRGVPA